MNILPQFLMAIWIVFINFRPDCRHWWFVASSQSVPAGTQAVLAQVIICCRQNEAVPKVNQFMNQLK